MNRSRQHLDGIRLMIQAAAALSLMALCVKSISKEIPSIEIVFFRSLFGLLLICALIRRKKVSFLGKHRFQLCLRGISGFLALAAFFYTIPRLPLGTAVLLNYTAPLFVVLLSRIFLKEKTTLLTFFLTLISFGGIYLLLKGQSAIDMRVGFIGLLSAMLAATAYVTIRSIKHHESPLTIIFYFTGISTLGAGAWMLPGFVMPQGIDRLYILGTGISAFLGQLWLTIALRRAPAPLVAPFSYLAPMLSFIYGVIFWQENLTFISVIGVCLIISGGSLISYFRSGKN